MVEYENGVFDGGKKRMPTDTVTTDEAIEQSIHEEEMEEKFKKLDITKYMKPL
jgi:hypothetical protein